jgi:hypothetical protein
MVEMERPETLAATSGRIDFGKRDGADSTQQPRGDQPGYPIVIAEWQRNSREIIGVALDRYNDRQTIDIRSCWQDGEGNWRPGRGDLTLGVKHLPALAEGLAEALQRAQVLGLLTPYDGA